MKEKRMGGGVRKCEKCGELINGSKIHRCNKDYFASVRNNITKSTENSGYTVYIPESAKKQEESNETWEDCNCKEYCVGGACHNGKRINCLNKPIKSKEDWDDVFKEYGKHCANYHVFISLNDWLKEHYSPPQKKINYDSKRI